MPRRGTKRKVEEKDDDIHKVVMSTKHGSQPAGEAPTNTVLGKVLEEAGFHKPPTHTVSPFKKPKTGALAGVEHSQHNSPEAAQLLEIANFQLYSKKAIHPYHQCEVGVQFGFLHMVMGQMNRMTVAQRDQFRTAVLNTANTLILQ